MIILIFYLEVNAETFADPRTGDFDNKTYVFKMHGYKMKSFIAHISNKFAVKH
jgi:hypothetical protein